MQESNGDGQILNPAVSAEPPTTKDLVQNVLGRQTPLTIEEITNIRSNELKPLGRKGREYKIGESTVSVWFNPIVVDDIPDGKKDETVNFLKSHQREPGEAYSYEHLLVNTLIEQLRIAEKFGLLKDKLYLSLNLNYTDKGEALLNDWGELYVRVLADHIDTLKQQGATEEQAIAEAAGHIFHEAIHQGVNDELLDGISPLGEITPVTAQLAYYLERGYDGPRSYDLHRYESGLRKIQKGETSVVDHDIATYIAVTLLLRSLQEEYPDFSQDIKDMDAISANESIVAKLPSGERQKLVPTLKKAIAQSADIGAFQVITEQLREAA